MTKKQKIKKRISYLRSEVAHAGRLDGWTLRSLQKELKELESTLLHYNGESISPDILGNCADIE